MAETTVDPLANVAQVRQQLRARLQGSLAQGQDLLAAYQEAYPHLDVATIQGALAPQPMYGVNIHGRPTHLSPAWIQEQTIEPLALGASGDPVSQLAFLAVPGPLKGSLRALDTALSPGTTVAVQVPRWALKQVLGVVSAGPAAGAPQMQGEGTP